MDLKCYEAAEKGVRNYYVEGFASAAVRDLDDDVITEEALKDAASQLLEEPYNKLFLNHNVHDIPIGKVVAAEVHDGKLWVRAVLNRDHERFEEVWSALKNGFLTAFSISFKVEEDELLRGGRRYIKRLRILEVSLVGVPANPEALITEVYEKGAVRSHSTPIVMDRAWDADAAVARIRRWASSDGSGDKDKIDWAKYRQAFAWYDEDEPENFGSYKLPHHDVVDGKFVAVWRGVVAAMAALFGARGGVDIPEEDRRGVYDHLAKHYRDAGREPPEFREYPAEALKSLFPEAFEGGEMNESTTVDGEVATTVKLEEGDGEARKLTEELRRLKSENEALREEVERLRASLKEYEERERRALIEKIVRAKEVAGEEVGEDVVAELEKKGVAELKSALADCVDTLLRKLEEAKATTKMPVLLEDSEREEKLDELRRLVMSEDEIKMVKERR